MKLAVVGAHLSGQPLNSQLTDRGAKLIRTTKTAPLYRLYALANTTPPKPGLLRTTEPAPTGIEVEIWDLSPPDFASFIDLIPPPLAIGTLEMEDGEKVKGFLVESYAVTPTTGAKDITHLGGWRNFLKTSQK